MWIALLTPALVAMGAFGLLLAALLVFAETGLLAGFFLPGDSLLFTVGVLTASGVLPLPILLVLACLVGAAVLGDTLGFVIGRRVGRRLFTRPRSRLFNPDHLTRAEAFIARHGHLAVVLARFVPWARTFVPVVAGAGSMPHRTFLGLNVSGGVVWVVGVTLAGYLLGSMPFVADHVTLVTLGLAVIAAAPIVAVRLAGRLRGSRRTPLLTA